MPLHAIDHRLAPGKREKSIPVTSGYIYVNIHLQQRAVIDVAKKLANQEFSSFCTKEFDARPHKTPLTGTTHIKTMISIPLHAIYQKPHGKIENGYISEVFIQLRAAQLLLW